MNTLYNVSLICSQYYLTYVLTMINSNNIGVQKLTI